jgi:UDP:flavonoid glycosyltransferase YjiC (YdhE family)
MRVLISSTKFSGHLNPLLPYADALIAMGHDVAVAAPEAVSQRLAQAGIAHLPVCEAADEDAEASRLRIDAASGALAVQAAAAEHFAGVLARASFPDLKRIIADWSPDLVLRESLELGALVAAAAAAIPCCRVGVHCGQGEMDFFPHLLAPVDRLRVGTGLPGDDGASLRSEAVFSAFPNFMDEGVDWLGTQEPFRVRPALAPTPHSSAARPIWAPADGETFVYVTLGTVSGRSEKSRTAYRAILEALSTLPVRALLTTGPIMPHEELGIIPPNVTVEAFVPQSEVMPYAHAVVCHGGSGSLIGALAQGIPTVVVPLFADQPHNAASVARAGAGISVTDRTAPVLREAIARVLKDDDIRRTAYRIGGDIAGMPVVEKAIECMVALAVGAARTSH